MRQRSLFPFTRLLFILVLAAGTVLLAGCDSGGSGMDGSDDGGMDNPPDVADQISYDLTAQSNDGAVPEGVSGTVTFWRAGPDTTLVTLDLDAEATAGGVSHPAHIHANSVSDGGDIEYYLSAVNGDSPNGTTARKIGESIEFFADFDGHVNVHESPANLGTYVAQGNIGANAEGTTGSGLDLVENPSTKTYPLSVSTTDGSVFPNGVTGSVTFQELTGSKTLVTYELDTNGSVSDANGGNVSVAQIGHIHQESLEEAPGGIANSNDDGFSGYLGSIDPTDTAARSSRVIEASYDDLTSYDGYVNIHQSNANAGYVFAQGNIGANAGNDGSSEVDVTVTIDNVDADAWEVTSVEDASGVDGGGENPTLTLTTDTRYRFVNDGGSTHPLGFQNSSDEYLLNQNQDEDGSFEGDSGVNYEEDSEGVTFTYTQDLADAVADYRCTVHPSMEGSVQTESSDDGGGVGGY